MGYQQPVAYYDQKSKLAAGLFGIFFGSLGVHNFYLGYTNKAVGQLVGTIVGYILCIIFIGFFIVVGIQIWALVEGILILSAQPGSQPWGVDARGVPCPAERRETLRATVRARLARANPPADPGRPPAPGIGGAGRVACAGSPAPAAPRGAGATGADRS